MMVVVMVAAVMMMQDIVVADSRMAVQSLLLTDELFRASNIATRKKYVQLVESVREHGGDVKICSALHVSGERTPSSGLHRVRVVRVVRVSCSRGRVFSPRQS